MLYNHVIDGQYLVMKDKKGRNIKHKYTVLNAFSKRHGIEKWYFYVKISVLKLLKNVCCLPRSVLLRYMFTAY